MGYDSKYMIFQKRQNYRDDYKRPVVAGSLARREESRTGKTLGIFFRTVKLLCRIL